MNMAPLDFGSSHYLGSELVTHATFACKVLRKATNFGPPLRFFCGDGPANIPSVRPRPSSFSTHTPRERKGEKMPHVMGFRRDFLNFPAKPRVVFDFSVPQSNLLKNNGQVTRIDLSRRNSRSEENSDDNHHYILASCLLCRLLTVVLTNFIRYCLKFAFD